MRVELAGTLFAEPVPRVSYALKNMSAWASLNRLHWLGLLCALLLTFACAPLPQGRYTLEAIHVAGNHELDDDELEKVMASRENSKLLWLFSGVIFDYEIFDRYVLERDLERIQRYYRARGYYETRVRAARVIYKGRHAKVYVEIEEGPAVLVARVDVHGLEALTPRLAARARAAALRQLPLGKPFEEGAFEKAGKQIVRRLENNGYAYARVRRSADVDLPRRRAAAGFWVEPGAVARFGSVRIEGLGPLPEAPIRRALDLKTGDPYSRAELDEAKQQLLNLGVFSSVSIEPDIKEGGEQPTEVPLVVKLEPSKLRSVRLGGGVQLDTQRTELHLIAGWENNNFLGGFRHFLIEATPGVVLYPTRLPNFQRTRHLLPVLRLRSEFRQPGFIESRTSGLIRAQGSISPVILGSTYDPNRAVLGYRELRGAVGLERSLGQLYGALSQNVQVSSPFVYVKGRAEPPANGDPTSCNPDDPNRVCLDMVVISYPELFLSWDLRNDRIAPHRGAYFSLDTQVAGLGGDARDVKIQPEARGYVPITRRVTLAARGTVGFLFPQNYGDTIAPNAETRSSGPAETRETWSRDIQLMFFRGFFSGGSSSNRGYATREIGPHGIVPFYNPGQSTMALVDCADPANISSRDCALPLGGFTLWEASLELRFPIKGALSGTLFSDTSDVSPYKVNFRFDRPHLSVGLGARYETPIGPVRLDVGYRVPGLQAPADARDEAVPREIFGLPIAASFGIGEAF